MQYLYLLLAALALGSAEKLRFDNYALISVMPQTTEQVDMLLAMEEVEAQLDINFWLRPGALGQNCHVMVAPHDIAEFERRVIANGMVPKWLHKNVQEEIDRETEELARATPFKQGDDPRTIALDQYHTYQEIMDYLDSLPAAFPNLVTVGTVGNTHEGRNQKFVKIGKASSTGSKMSFWLEAGIHAREWIAPATAIWIINELTTKYGHDSDITALLDGLDFYILPSINGDGYAYTHEHHRLWRKTRSGPYRHGCYGVDPNRNWDYMWGGAGTSNNPCSQVYHGPNVFSEVECKNIADYILANNATAKFGAHISLHSYSELWLMNWGNRRHFYPDDHDELVALANQGVAAIKGVHNTRYRPGSPPDILYAVTGDSVDWSKSKAMIKYSFTLELRPGRGDHDHDHHGFLLPARFIIRTADEAWAGIKVVAQKVADFSDLRHKLTLVRAKLRRENKLLDLRLPDPWFASDGYSAAAAHWLFALMAVVEKPLDPDVLASLRQLARCCHQLRAQLSSSTNRRASTESTNESASTDNDEKQSANQRASPDLSAEKSTNESASTTDDEKATRPIDDEERNLNLAREFCWFIAVVAR